MDTRAKGYIMSHMTRTEAHRLVNKMYDEKERQDYIEPKDSFPHEKVSNMKSMYSIVYELKEIQNIKKTYKVAEYLKIEYSTLRNQISRNSIPFRNILDYCKAKDIDAMKLLYEESK